MRDTSSGWRDIDGFTRMKPRGRCARRCLKRMQNGSTRSTGMQAGYELRVNEFADLSNEEFKVTRNRFKGHMCSEQARPFRYENVSDVPSTMDWRKKGAITLIKDNVVLAGRFPRLRP